MDGTDLHTLRVFVTVATTGHLTRAAELLHLSQSAVSAQVKGLETGLAVTLFERTAKGMLLTAAGERLLQQAQQVLAAHQTLLATAARMQGELRGRVRVGAIGDLDSLDLGRFVHRLEQRYPCVELHLQHARSSATLAAVRAGQLDAGYVVGEAVSPPLAAVTLKPITFRIAAPAAWRERVVTASWAEIAALPWIRSAPTAFCHRAGEALFRERGGVPDKVIMADHPGAVRTLIAAGVGLGLLPEERARAAESRGEVVIWPNFAQQAQLLFVYQQAREQDPLIGALKEVLWEAPVAGRALG